jgi:hypothetical protein
VHLALARGPFGAKRGAIRGLPALLVARRALVVEPGSAHA